MTPPEITKADPCDLMKMARDYARGCLDGSIPSVTSPQYALNGCLTALADGIERRNIALATQRQSYEARIAELEARALAAEAKLAEAVETERERCCEIFERAIGEGYPTPLSKHDKCEHGRFGWEDCIACYDEALFKAVRAARFMEGNGDG